MSQGLELDIKPVYLSSPSFGPSEIKQITSAIASDMRHYRALREAIQVLEQSELNQPTADGRLRLGVGYYLTGRYNLAANTLTAEEQSGLGQFYLGRANAAQGDFRSAAAALERAKKLGADAAQCDVFRAEALRQCGEAAEALKVLDNLFGPVEQTAEYLYQRGATIAAVGGNPSEVVALYQRAVDAEPRHPGALFGLAMENDRRGNDATAVELYERSVALFPPHLGSLLNLGLLYEDRNQFDRARHCYQRILDVYPNHQRARLFLKDASASNELVVDEDAAKKRDRMNQLFSIPVTDFELSVRSRNCLQKMGIMTLGNLCETTEQELLASKNFGETSLHEIKEMLSSKGLSLGQLAGEKQRTELSYEPSYLSPDEHALLNSPIAELNLSVRARKCMVRLGVSTVGELVRHTADELLECKNFGVTSLNEVREKLTAHGIRLRGD